MRIKEITDEKLIFDNGMTISFYHEQDCCEYNYADFKQIDDLARAEEFDPNNLVFEESDYGFLFGNKSGRMYFVPCYSEQNGYYSCDINILFNGKCVIEYLSCEEKFI